MKGEHSVEYLEGEAGVPGQTPRQRRFVRHKSEMTCLGLESGPLWWKAGDYPPELRLGLVYG
jgi:hypothetical protein